MLLLRALLLAAAAAADSSCDKKTRSLAKEVEKLSGLLRSEGMSKVSLNTQLVVQLNKNQELQAQVKATDKQAQTLQTRARDAVEAHNKVVAEFNELLEHDKKLLAKYNKLVHEYNMMAQKMNDPSLGEFLGAKAQQVASNPSIAGARNKSFIFVRPVLANVEQARKDLYNNTLQSVESLMKNSSLYTSVGAGTADPWLPFISGFIVYGMFCIPSVCTVWCLVEFVCKMKPMLLFGHCYLSAVSLFGSCVALYTGRDPLGMFASHDPSLYLFVQFAFALFLCGYAILFLAAVILEQEGYGGCWMRGCQFVGISAFIVGYYVLVWTPAMTDLPPRLGDLVATPRAPVLGTAAPYLLPTAIFFGAWRLEEELSQPPADGDPEKEEKDE